MNPFLHSYAARNLYRGEERISLSKCPQSAGFSLVEVVLALGVVSFSMLTMMGLLGVGLQTVHEAQGQEATANIVTQLRGQLQQLSFGTSQTQTVNNLAQTTYYYTADGLPTISADPTVYYKASFAVNTVNQNGGTPVIDANFAPRSAQSVTITLSYPQSAPTATQTQTVLSLIVANQVGQD